jgi:hypothetical protein
MARAKTRHTRRTHAPIPIDIQFDPIPLTDCCGVSHLFHFDSRDFGLGVSLDAFEILDGERGGYQFQVIGKPGVDLMVLLGELLTKIRRGLAVKFLENGEYGLRIADRTVLATISSDCNPEGSLPVLIIDGREIPWEYFGHILMTFEGWQFKLEIRDKSEEF